MALLLLLAVCFAYIWQQASTLIGGLAGERTRWTEDSEKSADLKRRLVGDCALGSAFVSYCGPFNQEFRQYMVTDKFTVDLQVNEQTNFDDVPFVIRLLAVLAATRCRVGSRRINAGVVALGESLRLIPAERPH